MAGFTAICVAGLPAAESQLAASHALQRQESEAEEGRRLAELLPTIGIDLYTHAAVRRQLMAAIVRIVIEDGQVVSVTLAAG